MTPYRTVFSTSSSSILKQFSLMYFFPVDVPTLVSAYFQAYKTTYDEIKADENGEFMIITTTLEVIKNNSKPIPFLSMIVQTVLRNHIDRDCILLNQGSESEFKLGNMLADAVMWSTQDKDIIHKIQQKYDLNSLIGVLDMNDESFHLLEVVVWLLRSCYLNPNDQLQIGDEPQISVIKQHIYKQLEKIGDISNISQLRFASESITFLSNCYYKKSKGDKLHTVIGTLLSSLLKDIDVYTLPNAFDFASGDDQTFFDYGLINNHNKIVDNEWYERDVVLETNQKELIAAILRLITKFGFKKLSLNKTELNSELFTCLNMNEQMIEKWIVLLILKLLCIFK